MNLPPVEQIGTAVAAFTAFIAFLGCVRAGLRHPYKRWIWFPTALGMLYYSISYADLLLLLINSPFFSTLLFRPVASLVFVFIFAHSWVDGRARNE